MIPERIRKVLNQDCYMRICANCGKPCPQWHHPFIYAGCQINEVWSLIPLCDICHKTKALNGDLSQWLALNRAFAICGIKRLSVKYPAYRWNFEYERLNALFWFDGSDNKRRGVQAIKTALNLTELFPEIREW